MPPAPLPSTTTPVPPAAADGPPAELERLLREFAATDAARACARPTGAYGNCLAVSVLCARRLRANGVECGLLQLTGSLVSLGAGAGRWPFCDPARVRHWTVRVGPWSIDWTARQLRRGAPWPLVERVDALPARWRVVDDWACHRCPEPLADERHVALAPAGLHREHRALARASGGLGPFFDPRHPEGTAALVSLCACSPPDAGATP
jgi:hypothetical protein